MRNKTVILSEAKNLVVLPCMRPFTAFKVTLGLF